MSFHHITENERIKIEALYKAGHTQTYIAHQLGFSRSAICREIKRGLVEQLNGHDWIMYKTYSAHKAQVHHEQQCTAKGAPLKIGHDYALMDYIETKIMKEHYSPQAVVEAIAINDLHFSTTLSKATIYNYIDSGLFLALENKHLLRKSRKSTKKATPPRVAKKNVLKKIITDRPKEIGTRDTFGHWEMDTVIGKSSGENAVLLVLTERKTRYEYIIKIPGKKAKCVTAAIDRLYRKMGNKKFRQIFKSITVDNGVEFSDDEGIEKNNRTSLYYCHTYSSWERGSNENQNSIIRRFIPKGVDITSISQKQITRIQDWINNYPRSLYHSTAAIEYAKELSKLA